jgi:hypothetical protein
MIFISYRREDALQIAARLEHSLTGQFGPHLVFRDATSTVAGDDFPAVLAERSRTCRIMLALIGPRWQTVAHTTGPLVGYPRLADPADWVRQEIRTALDHQRRVIPVLLDGTHMPAAEWLRSCGLAELADRQARPLRSDEYVADLDRLTTDILRNVPDLARRAGPAARPPGGPARVRHGQVPVVRPYFTGRVRELERLEEALSANEPSIAPVVALVGIGGVGKTQLAAHYYRRHQTDGRYAAMAWIDGRSDIATQLLAFARALGLDDGAGPADTTERLLGWLQGTESAWLIVVDNVADPGQVGALLGVGGAGRLLVTTRYRFWDEHARAIDIDVFPINVAAGLLKHVARRPVDPDADALAASLGCLPLALAIAGAGCRENAYPFDRYRAMVESHPLDPDDGPLRAVWRDSLALASTRAPTATAVLGLLARLDWRDIDRAWLTRGLSATPVAGDLDRALAALNAYQLIVLTEQTVAVAHGIIATGVVAGADPPDRAVADDLMVRLFSATLPEPAADLNTVVAAAGPIRHLLALVTAVPPPQPDGLVEILFRACNQLRDQRDHDRYGALADRTLRNVELLRGETHTDTLTARSHVAVSLWLAGRNGDAMPIFEQIVRDRTRLLGADHPDTLLAWANLAVSYQHEGRVAAAVPILELVVAERTRIQGQEHPRTMTARAQLGIAYREDARADDAVAVFADLVRDRRSVLGPEHPDTLTARFELALAVRQTGGVAEAAALLEAIATERKRVLGPDHPHVYSTWFELALAYRETGRAADAGRLLEQVVAERGRVLGPRHPHTLQAAATLAGGPGGPARSTSS